MSLHKPGHERPDALRFLNQPRPIQILTERTGPDQAPTPIAVLDGGRTRSIERVEETWLIDDEWWRRRIRRRYYRLLLADGPRMVVFHDHVEDAWYAQGY